ncbi:hypothetical protein Tco_0865234 [Tanacetum coccineum]
MIESNKKQYITDVKVMNYLLQAILNGIYNLVDACKNAKEMWEQIKRLMFGYDVTNHVRHSRLDEFENFAAKERESLESVYDRLTTLVNIMDRNNVCPIPVSINTKFLNCLQPEWSKYVTMDGRVDIQTKNAGCGGNGLYARDCTKPIVRDAKYFREQMLLAKKDEVRSNLNDEENDFMLDNSFGDETLEELTAAVIMMARIQPADDNGVQKPNYDAKAVSEFDKSMTSGKLLCVTPLSNNIAVHAKKDSNPEDNTDRSKPVTSHSTPKNKQQQKKNANVIARGIVGSSNSVRRPKSKDTKSKNKVLKNNNAKSSAAYVRKMPSSVRIDSSKRETKNSNECQSNASVLNTKNVTVVNDGSNIFCVSYGKYVFMLSHEKCVARYALSGDSRVKRALFTTPVAAQSKNLGATSVVAKSRFSIAKTPTLTNKVSSVSSLSPDSKQSRTLSNYMKNKIATSRK